MEFENREIKFVLTKLVKIKCQIYEFITSLTLPEVNLVNLDLVWDKSEEQDSGKLTEFSISKNRAELVELLGINLHRFKLRLLLNLG